MFPIHTVTLVTRHLLLLLLLSSGLSQILQKGMDSPFEAFRTSLQKLNFESEKAETLVAVESTTLSPSLSLAPQGKLAFGPVRTKQTVQAPHAGKGILFKIKTPILNQQKSMPPPPGKRPPLPLRHRHHRLALVATLPASTGFLKGSRCISTIVCAEFDRQTLQTPHFF